MRSLHLVSHTHWDREWYLPFQEFRLKLVHLMDHLLDLLARYPGYQHFMLDGQTIILDDYLEIRPEREEELRGYVQSGRLHIGPWHILPDEFLVSPEAIIRNLLQGDQTARRFGSKMPVGYIPDPFGHIGQMPQILRGFGLEDACLQRGVADQPCELWWQSPDGSKVFLAYLRDSYANAAALLHKEGEEFVEEVRRVRNSLAPYTATEHMLFMQGNDHTEPSAHTAAAIKDANQALEENRLTHATLNGYIEAVRREIDERQIEIPTLIGELRAQGRHHLLPGVLSTRVWIKQRNHTCETILEKWAEPFSTFAESVSDETPDIKTPNRVRRPAPVLQHAWRLLMENHPHDSICGCSIDQVHDEMKPRFDQVEQIGEEITRQSLETLLAAADNHPPDSLKRSDILAAVSVFNPIDYARSDAVEIKLPIPPQTPIEFVNAQGDILQSRLSSVFEHELIHMNLDRDGLTTLLSNVQDGKLTGQGAVEGLAIQNVGFERKLGTLMMGVKLSESGEPDENAMGAAMVELMQAFSDPEIERFDVRAVVEGTIWQFLAEDVPCIGYRTFWVRRASETSQSSSEQNQQEIQVTKTGPRSDTQPSIENEFFQLSVSPEDGVFTVVDKRSGKSYSGLNRFIDGGDRGDEYNYSPPKDDEFIQAELQSIDWFKDSLSQRVKVKLTLKVPADLREDRAARSLERLSMQITTHAELFPGVPRVDIHTVVDNPARDHRLRVHFPAPFDLEDAGDRAFYDGHFEVLPRSTDIPQEVQAWTELPTPTQPQRLFCSISDGETGLTIANRGLREAEVLQNEDGVAEIALTLLRCVGWLSRDDFPARKSHAGPGLPTPDAQMLGLWSFDYTILPHAGDWQEAFRPAAAFNAPLRAAGGGIHPGILKPTQSFLKIQSDGFLLSAVKACQDGRGWIVRGYNLTDEPQEVLIQPWKRFGKVELADLAERPLRTLTPETSGAISFSAGPHRIVTLRFSDEI